MRSSKSRSRSKQNRPRSLGNIVNRVFDSSGPEGKVRGTPQQIIEKYQALARDAQLGNDRVAAENFLQHAEHYTRMLGEALREMASEQEARRQHAGGGNGQPDRPARGDDRPGDERTAPPAEAFAVADLGDAAGSTLVETPESRDPAPAEVQPQPQTPPAADKPAIGGERRRNERRPRTTTPAPVAADEPGAVGGTSAEATAVAADDGEAPAKPRRTRTPRKPKEAPATSGPMPADNGGTAAAE